MHRQPPGHYQGFFKLQGSIQTSQHTFPALDPSLPNENFGIAPPPPQKPHHKGPSATKPWEQHTSTFKTITNSASAGLPTSHDDITVLMTPRTPCRGDATEQGSPDLERSGISAGSMALLSPIELHVDPVFQQSSAIIAAQSLLDLRNAVPLVAGSSCEPFPCMDLFADDDYKATAISPLDSLMSQTIPHSRPSNHVHQRFKEFSQY